MSFPTELCDTNRALLLSFLFFKYLVIASVASGDKKTSLNLSPFPRTVNSPLFKLTVSFFKEAISETRRPVRIKYEV